MDPVMLDLNRYLDSQDKAEARQPEIDRLVADKRASFAGKRATAETVCGYITAAVGAIESVVEQEELASYFHYDKFALGDMIVREVERLLDDEFDPNLAASEAQEEIQFEEDLNGGKTDD